MSRVMKQRTMSGTIPSMETTHEELRDNTVIVGQYLSPRRYSNSHSSIVCGASGDLAKKKASLCGTELRPF
jgi:glucose-6-phosphate 1-dehydrogenase